MTGRRLSPVILVTVVLGVGLVVSVWPRQPQLHGSVIEAAPYVQPIELAAATGDRILFPDAYRGRLTLVFFGYTNCPDVCPLTMAQLATIHRDLDEPTGLQVVMVTVDPAQDTPEVVDAYAKRFHPDFTGLGGDPSPLAAAAEAFFVGHHHVGDEVAHSGHVTLLDRDGRMRLVYTQDKVPSLGRDLPYLLARKRW